MSEDRSKAPLLFVDDDVCFCGEVAEFLWDFYSELRQRVASSECDSGSGQWLEFWW